MFTPEISSIYRPRRSLRALAHQFWDYGWWKAEVMVRHPDSIRGRHLLPPIAVILGLACFVLAALGHDLARVLVLLGIVGYFGVIMLAVRRERPTTAGASTMHFTAALPIIHIAWGAGLVGGAPGAVLRRTRRSKATPDVP